MNNLRKTLFTLAGSIIGVIVVHPYVMLVHQFTGPGHDVEGSSNYIAVNLFATFSPTMLPMTIAFVFFGGACGLLLGLLFERNERIVRYQYRDQLQRDLTGSLQQLLAAVSHYILNSSMVISGQTRRLHKNAGEEDRQTLGVILQQAEKNERIIKLMKEAEFLQNIDPSDSTYKKLIALNRQIEEHLKE